MAKLCIAMGTPVLVTRLSSARRSAWWLERRARAEKLPFQDVQRARIVLYAAEGLA